MAVEPDLIHSETVWECHVAQSRNSFRPAGAPFAAVFQNGRGNRRRNNPGGLPYYFRRFLFSIQSSIEAVEAAGDLFSGRTVKLDHCNVCIVLRFFSQTDRQLVIPDVIKLISGS